jgi:hypothetical protein
MVAPTLDRGPVQLCRLHVAMLVLRIEILYELT